MRSSTRVRAMTSSPAAGSDSTTMNDNPASHITAYYVTGSTILICDRPS